MIVPTAMTESYRRLLGSLHSDMASSVRDVVAGVGEAELPAALATVVDPYMDLGSMASATFFEEMREYQGAGGRYVAQTVTGSEAERVNVLAGLGLRERTVQGAASTIAGGASRLLTERVNDTMIGNAEADVKVTWKYQRVPRANCCEFCGMLASRGAVYRSEAAAGQVVGRGTPIPADGVKRAGGQAKGIKPRGSQRMGETYHDNCYCAVVAVMNGVGVQMSDADRDDAQAHWLNVYERAKADAAETYVPKFDVKRATDGSLMKTWYWEDAKGNKFRSKGVTNRIVNAMRREKYADAKDAA